MCDGQHNPLSAGSLSRRHAAATGAAAPETPGAGRAMQPFETQIQLPPCAMARADGRGRAADGRDNADTDRALMTRIVGGDERALEMLFGRHRVRVYRFVLRLLGNEGTAEDVVSEVFFHVWRHAGAFEGRSEVSTWLL